MRIVVTKPMGKEYADKACSFTVNKDVEVNLDKLYRSEHSPCRSQLFIVEMYDIFVFCSTHLVRHKHGVEHFCKSNRDDRSSHSEDLGRLTLTNHMMIINAQALINMARKRLCGKTHETTQRVMHLIKTQVAKIDPYLAKYMVRECEYRKECPEFKSCGFWKVIE